ncbi:MAG: polyprenyl synthetase family protein [Micrococcus sp.]|nr:polyprenyl synthetase family protein [Micrococcus sp.]
MKGLLGESTVDVDGVRACLSDALDRLARFGATSPTFTELVGVMREHTVGGKLVRPQLVDLGYRAVKSTPATGAEREAVERLGAAFELLHTALIVHDDVIDRDTLRRGKPTLAEQYRQRLEAAGVPATDSAHAGASVAVIGGDALLTEALRLAATSAGLGERAGAVAAVVFDSATAAAAGELDDVLLSLHRHTGEEPEVERILVMQRLKTAGYSFEAPLRAGALIAGADEATAATLAEAGADLGVAYQVVDDLLGVFGSPEDTGKSAAGDLREGKATVVTAHGRRDPRIRALLEAAPVSAEDLDAAREALDEGGSRAHALTVARDLVRRGQDLLDTLEMGPTERAQFAAACHAILHRRS